MASDAPDPSRTGAAAVWATNHRHPASVVGHRGFRWVGRAARGTAPTRVPIHSVIVGRRGCVGESAAHRPQRAATLRLPVCCSNAYGPTPFTLIPPSFHGFRGPASISFARAARPLRPCDLAPGAASAARRRRSSAPESGLFESDQSAEAGTEYCLGAAAACPSAMSAFRPHEPSTNRYDGEVTGAPASAKGRTSRSAGRPSAPARTSTRAVAWSVVRIAAKYPSSPA